ncbi:MAG: hypothetical protein LBM77_10605 [Spirochaetaceae bacterium]|jgi:hypothetical protein|nr:hypothetical protein [Spirochaetaceae bacterium]
MKYTLTDIKHDLVSLPPRDIFIKYIIRSDNWYFENVLGIPEKNIRDIIDEFNILVSSTLGVNFNSVMAVGSSKIGYSLSPRKGKTLKNFSTDGKERKISDIDIAIVSNRLFNHYWELFRSSYTIQNEYHYKYIARGIYRGYINERDLVRINECRKEWSIKANQSKKELRRNLYLKHDISYRIYRSWEDFEEYNIQSINTIKELYQYGKNT